MLRIIKPINIFIAVQNNTNEWKSTIKRALGYSLTVVQYQMHSILKVNI